MTHLEARSELLDKAPRVPLVGMAIEAIALVGIAGLLVLFIA